MKPAHFKESKSRRVLPNGRDRKPPVRFEDCWTKVSVSLVIHPTWRHLTASAKDILLIFMIKAGVAAARGVKDNEGRPLVKFVYKEAKELLNMPAPTFDRVLGELQEKGFMAITKHGGILNGKGSPTQYNITDKWKDWHPPPVNTKNIEKARAAKKKKAEKAVKIEGDNFPRNRP